MKSNELCLDELNKEANTKNKKNFYQLTNRCFPVYTINRLYSCKMHALYTIYLKLVRSQRQCKHFQVN